MKLPPVSDQPLANGERLVCLGEPLNRFLESLIGDQDVYRVQRTRTKVDVGHWTGKRRLWCCLLAEEMLLFAKGRRTFVERMPRNELRESQYNYVTGEIVLAPIENTQVQTLNVEPLDALEILAYICTGDKHGSS